MNWDRIAIKLGYVDFETMFLTLYVVRKYPLSTIAKELGCSIQTLRRLVSIHELNSYLQHKGRRVTDISEDELIGTLDEAAAKTGLHRSTIWYRRKQIAKITKDMKHISELTSGVRSLERDKKDYLEVPDEEP